MIGISISSLFSHSFLGVPRLLPRLLYLLSGEEIAQSETGVAAFLFVGLLALLLLPGL